MPPTPFQREILRLLASQRRERGESYVAGGVALNELLAAPRKSRDIDLFHDSLDALSVTWEADRATLIANGYEIQVHREALSRIEATVSRGGDRVLMEWARESAFRFFPLIEDDLLGLALHPFDLATNKVLAMAGRLETRDWIDVITCDEKVQPFGYLIWAACGKDPGFNPQSLLAEAAKAHYSQADVDILDFEAGPPSAAELGSRWHETLREAKAVCAILPADQVGKCVATPDGRLFRETASGLVDAVKHGRLLFHAGRLGGAWPTVRAE